MQEQRNFAVEAALTALTVTVVPGCGRGSGVGGAGLSQICAKCKPFSALWWPASSIRKFIARFSAPGRGTWGPHRTIGQFQMQQPNKRQFKVRGSWIHSAHIHTHTQTHRQSGVQTHTHTHAHTPNTFLTGPDCRQSTLGACLLAFVANQWIINGPRLCCMLVVSQQKQQQ